LRPRNRRKKHCEHDRPREYRCHCFPFADGDSGVRPSRGR
jgi:hypothetical protein